MPTTTTTLSPNACQNALAFDEVLVQLLQNVPAVIAANAKVYHIDVWQNQVRAPMYPAVVYQLVDDVPELELAGTSNFYKANYEVTVYGTADILRSISNGLQIFNDGDFNTALAVANCNIDWISIVSDTEQVEYALEQQEPNIKFTTHTVNIDHWGKL